MRLIDADEFKRYCLDGLIDILPNFRIVAGKQAAITATADFCKDIDEQPTVEGELMKWIPFVVRPSTDEEYEKHGWCYVLEGEIPEDEEEILVTDGEKAWLDIWHHEDEFYLDGGEDIHDLTAWMPLPKPYKGDGNDQVCN